jgi:hypothetical protein
VTEAILVALITGGLSLAGVVITSVATARKHQRTLEVTQAVMRTELEELTREVRAHNDFARRMPVVEEQIKGVHRRLAELEGFHRPVH